MKRALRVPFDKLHGLGNDFIISAGAITMLGEGPGSGWIKVPLSTAALRRLARAICERHTGIGADGFLLVVAARKPVNHARVRFFNADGSEAEMSGNGIRCAGVVLMESGEKNPLRIETMAGVKVLDAVESGAGGWMFRVEMGRPVLEPGEIPFGAKRIPAPVVGYMLATQHGKHRVTVTSMGNPHCSIFVKSFDRVDASGIGREIEIHPLFPNRTNVEFVRVVSRRHIEVKFWERGVGITASSGTGSCGAAVASILNGFTDRSLRVQTLAGSLEVEWPEGGEVTLTGPAAKIAEGSYLWSSRSR